MEAFRATGCAIARAPSQILSVHGDVPAVEDLTKLVGVYSVIGGA